MYICILKCNGYVIFIDQNADIDMECENIAKVSTAVGTEDTFLSMRSLQVEYQRLLEENRLLKLKVPSEPFRQQYFENNDSKVLFHTGLPNFITLMILFNYVKDFIPTMSCKMIELNGFQQLILTLMKLRHNFDYRELAEHFFISNSTVSRIFLKVLHVLFIRLKPVIIWPEREDLRISMPMAFRKDYGDKVVSIIDCFEVKIDQPSNLRARSQTWSHYKHHHTIKYLIGITPQGSIFLISKGYGGRVSDKFIVDHCSFLNNLIPGDVVLADRGFNIETSVAMMGATLNIPAFTRGKSQLSATEVESTRKIARVRIHVERVIRSLRQKYSILRSVIPIDFLKSCDEDIITLDKITVVSCALVNLCPSVVPSD